MSTKNWIHGVTSPNHTQTSSVHHLWSTPHLQPSSFPSFLRPVVMCTTSYIMRHYSHEPSFASPILTPLDLMVWVVACGGGGCASNDTMSVSFNLFIKRKWIWQKNVHESLFIFYNTFSFQFFYNTFFDVLYFIILQTQIQYLTFHFMNSSR